MVGFGMGVPLLATGFRYVGDPMTVFAREPVKRL
jgi:hypothetical protein